MAKNSERQILLEVVDISKSFGSKVVLRNVSFKVFEKEIFCILGPSGAGKTTLLRIIAGLIKPSSGHIFIGGVCQDKIPPQERNVGFVFQNPESIFPHLNVFDNVAFPFKLRRRKQYRGNWKKEVFQILNMLNLSSHLRKYPSTLSGGECQRVALARAFVYRPPLLLLDEPLKSLDNELRNIIIEQILDMREKFKSTLIYVTHDEREALSLGDRIAVLLDGQMSQIGEPSDLIKNPSSERVAKISGAWNILHGEIENKDHDKLIIKFPELDKLLTIKVTNANNYTIGQSVAIGIPINSMGVQFKIGESLKNKIYIQVKIEKIVQWYGGYRVFGKYGGFSIKADLPKGFSNFEIEEEIFLYFPIDSIRIWPIF
jgi:ABC-type Fe3+/spermidine/putrescine transport system ATPase subunit